MFKKLKKFLALRRENKRLKKEVAYLEEEVKKYDSTICAMIEYVELLKQKEEKEAEKPIQFQPQEITDMVYEEAVSCAKHTLEQ